MVVPTVRSSDDDPFADMIKIIVARINSLILDTQGDLDDKNNNDGTEGTTTILVVF
jgi:hypothetical protein